MTWKSYSKIGLALGVIGGIIAFQASLVTTPAHAQGQNCKPGFRKIYEDKKSITCEEILPSADSAKLKKIESRLKELDEQIARDRIQIEKFRKQLPGFFEALDEWTNRSEKARKQAFEEAFDLFSSLYVRHKLDTNAKAMTLTRDRTERLRKVWMSRLGRKASIDPKMIAFRDKLFRDFSGQVTTAQVYQAVGAYKTVLNTSAAFAKDGATAKNVSDAIMEILMITVEDPNVKTFLSYASRSAPPIKFADAGINYAFAATSFVKSWQRINQLVDTKIPAAAKALQKTQQRHFEERMKLRAERARLGGEGGK